MRWPVSSDSRASLSTVDLLSRRYRSTFVRSRLKPGFASMNPVTAERAGSGLAWSSASRAENAVVGCARSKLRSSRYAYASTACRGSWAVKFAGIPTGGCPLPCSSRTFQSAAVYRARSRVPFTVPCARRSSRTVSSGRWPRV